MRLELTTNCMASKHSDQLNYVRFPKIYVLYIFILYTKNLVLKLLKKILTFLFSQKKMLINKQIVSVKCLFVNLFTNERIIKTPNFINLGGSLIMSKKTRHLTKLMKSAGFFSRFRLFHLYVFKDL